VVQGVHGEGNRRSGSVQRDWRRVLPGGWPVKRSKGFCDTNFIHWGYEQAYSRRFCACSCTFMSLAVDSFSFLIFFCLKSFYYYFSCSSPFSFSYCLLNLSLPSRFISWAALAHKEVRAPVLPTDSSDNDQRAAALNYSHFHTVRNNSTEVD